MPEPVEKIWTIPPSKDLACNLEREVCEPQCPGLSALCFLWEILQTVGKLAINLRGGPTRIVIRIAAETINVRTLKPPDIPIALR